jgi:hypothetical protein
MKENTAAGVGYHFNYLCWYGKILVTSGEQPYFIPNLAAKVKQNTNFNELIHKSNKWSMQHNLQADIQYRNELDANRFYFNEYKKKNSAFSGILLLI